MQIAAVMAAMLIGCAPNSAETAERPPVVISAGRTGGA